MGNIDKAGEGGAGPYLAPAASRVKRRLSVAGADGHRRGRGRAHASGDRSLRRARVVGDQVDIGYGHRPPGAGRGLVQLPG